MNWTTVGSLLLALAVMLGAFGAHGLSGRIDIYSMGIYERAVFYHFVHALGLLVVPMLARLGLVAQPAASWAALLLLIGIVVFCGSLYLLAATGVRMLGAITPLGGVAFIAAWIVLAWGTWKK